MSGLVPEKRQDRNGRLVTRHVRADTGAPAKKSAIPARPALRQPEEHIEPRAPKPVPLRASQRKLKSMTIPRRDIAFLITRELDPFGFDEEIRFTASEAEAYDVASACTHLGDAVIVLQRGIRSGDAARDFLRGRGLERLIGEGSDLLAAALAHGVRFEDFVKHPWIVRSDKPVEDRIGALRFAASSLGGSIRHTSVHNDILEGRIDFEDIKAIGIGRLRAHDQLLHYAPLLKKVHAGDEGFSVEALCALAVRLESDEGEHIPFPGVLAFADLVTPDVAVGFPLRIASSAYSAVGPNGKFALGAAEKALYFARFLAAVDDVSHEAARAAREFYDAGVPVDRAISVRISGGGSEQAVAMGDDGIPDSLAGGAL